MIDQLHKIYWSQRTNLRERYKLHRAKYFGPYPGVWDSKVIFIHVPKAAGSSIAKLNVGATFGHQTYGFYEKWRPKGRDMPPTFTVVRHPFSRYVSAFRYLNEGRGNHLDTAWARRNSVFSSDVNSFALQHLAKPAVQNWMHFKPQAEFTKGQGKKVAIDHVLRFEKLDTQWAAFARQFDLNETLPIKKLAASAPSTKLSDEAKSVIREIYKEDFEIFDYDSAL